MNPLFQVGEKVLVVSKDRPDCNGEYFVHKILIRPNETTYTCRLSGKKFTLAKDSSVAYLLDIPFMDTRKNTGGEAHWAESALRKIYPPSTESFDEMMRNIKQGKIIDNLVEEFV